ncbi:nuclear body protein SP140-like protein [Pygocentrus nattereri]|uniref:PHD-type domain-containing protein n=1 Tax=Pygocentrus nattereri TaxID=42514 RepID=A0A3B4C9S5_PYGNA|nr:nuclear body protein SP140-like protein [Pygocentrus nattereri]
MKMRSQDRVRKMLARGLKKNGQLQLIPVRTSYQKMSPNRPASSPSLSKLLGEKIRNNLLLTVRCGDKKGKLHKERFNNSKQCILSQSRWFTPPQFEKFAGMEKHKKWKSSIYYEHLPLQTLIQEGFLSSPSFKLRRIQDAQPQYRKALFAPSRRTRHVTESSSDYSSSDDDRDEEEYADMTQFQGETFPVTCSAGRGILHKSRFATVRCGKCIRTEDSWLTPQQFLNLNRSGGNWRRDITSHGEPLGTLIMRRVLVPHTVNCVCSSCSGENQLDQENDDLCFNCNSEGDEGDDLVCCDECPRAFHHHCHNPPLQDDTLGDRWICSYCTAARNQSHE